MATLRSILTLGIFYTPFVDFKNDLFESLNVLIFVKFAVTGVTATSSKLLIGDKLLTLPFYVNIHPPSKYDR
jgi:hypothetical protein